MRTRWLGGLVILTVAVLSACGGSTPEGVDVDVDGQDIEIVADGETMNVDGGADAKVPDDFPGDIPLPAGDPTTAAKVGSGDEQAWSLVYPSSDEATFEAYVAQLAAAPGAVAGMSANQAGMRTETFTIGGYDVVAQLIPDMTVAVLVTQAS